MKRIEVSLFVALLSAAPAWSGESDTIRAVAQMQDKTPLSEQISTIDLLTALEKAKLEYLKHKKEALALEKDIERMERPQPKPMPEKPEKPAKKRANDSSMLGSLGPMSAPPVGGMMPSNVGSLVLEGVNRVGRAYEARLRRGGQVLYMRVGDRLGAWRLKRITATGVVFEGPGGRVHRVGYRDGDVALGGAKAGGIDASALEGLLK